MKGHECSQIIVKDIFLLERAQRHATKYILNNYSDMSYAERCKKTFYFTTLFLPKNIDLVLFYQYLHNYADFEFSSYFELVGFLHSLRSSNNSTLLKLPRIKTTALQVSYYIALCVCGILCLGISVRQEVYFLSKNMVMISIFQLYLVLISTNTARGV